MQKNQLLALAVLFFISGVFGTSPVIEQHQVYATTPSPTPVTSSSIGALSGLQNAIANTMNNGCSLPCILGFRPEQTELFEILAFLEIDPNGAMAGEYTLDYAFSDPTISSDNYLISIQFHMYENIFNSATVYIEHPHDWLPAKTYRLQDAIASIQTTPEVYIAIKGNLGLFFIVLVYDSEGIMADYTYYFEAEEFVINTSKEIVFCPKPERNTKLVLWLQDKNSDIAIEDRMYPQMPSGSLRKDNFYRPITQVMGSTSAEFINQLKLHPDACFRGFSYDQLERAGQKF